MHVSRLGYVGFDVSDVGAWRTFATQSLGLMLAEDSGNDLLLRMDSRAWRIAVHGGGKDGPTDDVAYIGFEVADAAALAGVIERLARHDVVVGQGDTELATRRRALGVATCTAPGGLQVEICYGASERFDMPFASPAGVSGFMTGDEGLGHMVLYTPDMQASLAFFIDGLGCELSDIIDMPVGPTATMRLQFLHCNGRHHTIALAQVPAPKRLNHLMLEVASLDDVGLAYDRLPAQGVPITATLGRHTNDHMVSFYCATPSGFDVEFGWGARHIGNDWTVVRHDAPSIWGHKRSSPRNASSR